MKSVKTKKSIILHTDNVNNHDGDNIENRSNYLEKNMCIKLTDDIDRNCRSMKKEISNIKVPWFQ